MSDQRAIVDGAGPIPRDNSAGIKLAAAYVATLLLGVALYFLIRHIGNGLAAPPVDEPIAKVGAPKAGPNVLAHVLLALAAVVGCARLFGAVCKRVHQPPVIGEVIAGIVLGPSLLGHFFPLVMTRVFPPEVVPPLGIIAQVGVILFMFIIGLELNTDRLQERTHAALAISHASIIAPFVLGSALSLQLYTRYSNASVPFTAFSLFMGVSLSVTAFPVLARILTDRQLHRTRMGTIALTCAAVDDVTAWCLLAFVVGIVHAQAGAALVTFSLTLLYIGFMFLIARPFVHRQVERFEQDKVSEQTLMAMACIALLLSCLATEWIGIHALFGAFLLGALIPHDSRASVILHHKLNDFVVVLLLPAFFALTGLRTQIGLVGPEHWLTCVIIILVASIGKVGGSALAGRLAGLSWRDAGALGVLMNTRGLMGLIVLSVGLDLGVISPRLFALLVIMAVVTTLATTPLLDRMATADWRREPDEET